MTSTRLVWCVTANDLSAPRGRPVYRQQIWAGLAAARQTSQMQPQERTVRNAGKRGMPIFPVWTPQRSSSLEPRAQSAPRREMATNRTVPRVGSVYSFQHILIFLHCILNLALRSTISTSVAYWRRSRNHCLPKQRLRLLKQGGHDRGFVRSHVRLHSLECA
jgi:hypothetical protein